MGAGGRRRGLIARAASVAAAVVVVAWSAREVGARLVLGRQASLPSDVDAGLATDVPLRVARAKARLAAGDPDAARVELRVALSIRPRDPEVLLLFAEASETTAERLRFAAVAAREAPHLVAPAEFAFATAFAAVDARAPRAASARETATRLVAANVAEGVADARSEAERLEGEMRAYLSMALSTHASTSPTARGMFFLEGAAARARALAAELDAP